MTMIRTTTTLTTVTPTDTEPNHLTMASYRQGGLASDDSYRPVSKR